MRFNLMFLCVCVFVQAYRTVTLFEFFHSNRLPGLFVFAFEDYSVCALTNDSHHLVLVHCGPIPTTSPVMEDGGLSR